MTFIPARLTGDRITLKDGSHWTIAECFGRLGIDDYYEVTNGAKRKLAYADEIASPAPTMRGRQSFGRALRPKPPVPVGGVVLDYAGAEAELARKSRPYQAAAFATLDPETTNFQLTPGLGKVHVVPCDYDEAGLRRLMDRDQ